jgi:hypothetical protein
LAATVLAATGAFFAGAAAVFVLVLGAVLRGVGDVVIGLTSMVYTIYTVYTRP